LGAEFRNAGFFPAAILPDLRVNFSHYFPCAIFFICGTITGSILAPEPVRCAVLRPLSMAAKLGGTGRRG